MYKEDLQLISGDFFDYEIPKEKKYLLKYFTNKIQVAFLRYYMIFGTKKNFTHHTGYACSEALLYRFEKRYKLLTNLYEKSKSSFSEDGLKVLSLIESGKFNLRKLEQGDDDNERTICDSGIN